MDKAFSTSVEAPFLFSGCGFHFALKSKRMATHIVFFESLGEIGMVFETYGKATCDTVLDWLRSSRKALLRRMLRMNSLGENPVMDFILRCR